MIKTRDEIIRKLSNEEYVSLSWLKEQIRKEYNMNSEYDQETLDWVLSLLGESP